jgi:demethoxyubiquinone hydroxylase (CLK1/Coq7/Cat5 family)
MLKKMTCRALIVSMFALSFQGAGAGMIGADRAATSAVDADRAVVLHVLERAETVAQLQAQGVDAAQARERVAAMNDEEVSRLAADIRSAPAGASSILLVAAVVAAVWYFFFRR